MDRQSDSGLQVAMARGDATCDGYPRPGKKVADGGAGHSGGNGLLVDTLFLAAIVANQYSSKVIT